MVNTDAGDDETLALHSPTIHHAGGQAGDQDEHFGRVGEHQRLQCKLRYEIVGEMIDENTEEREAAEKIDPKVAPHSRWTARDAHNYFPVTSSDHHQHDGWFVS